jgi:hypothetical protein
MPGIILGGYLRKFRFGPWIFVGFLVNMWRKGERGINIARKTNEVRERRVQGDRGKRGLPELVEILHKI